jgi:hypothetical protein
MQTIQPILGMVRDTWRAVLVVVVVCLLREILAERQAPPPSVATQYPPAWQPAPQPVWQPVVIQQEPQRPLRRVGEAFVDLADSVIGVVRR